MAIEEQTREKKDAEFQPVQRILSSFAVLRHLRRSAASCLRRLWMTNRLRRLPIHESTNPLIY